MRGRGAGAVFVDQHEEIQMRLQPLGALQDAIDQLDGERPAAEQAADSQAEPPEYRQTCVLASWRACAAVYFAVAIRTGPRSAIENRWDAACSDIVDFPKLAGQSGKENEWSR